MQREEFLNQPDVAGFITWLLGYLPGQEFHLRMASSRFVPGGLDVRVRGLTSVLPHYIWETDWINPHNKPIHSSDWKTTRLSLKRLREWICKAMDNKDEDEVLAACLEILRWGGVRGAIPFLKQLHHQGRLVNYFQCHRSLMALNSNPSQRLSQLSVDNVERFDAGITKIHALVDDGGLPIYDSRVGAAMAMLYSLYRLQPQVSKIPSLKFPSGGARGQQIRNPEAFGYPKAPQFYTEQVPHEEWARWQVRLGWILRAILEQCNWFEQEGDMATRCHAFEASLFMVGYDLRCFCGSGQGSNYAPTPVTSTASKQTGWVPSGHNFSIVIGLYKDYRKQNRVNNRKDFRNWLVKEKKYSPATATSYCFPLGSNEFDLFECSMEDLECIAKGGEQGLYAALGSSEPYVAGDERAQVCLVDAWLTGHLTQLAINNTQKQDVLIQAGFAGTQSAASTLLSVGSKIGRHFGLLTQKNAPTEFYHRFYGDSMNDLESALKKSALENNSI